MTRAEIKPAACAACPYRKDAPEGLWAPEEYLKLPGYDAPTSEQPFAAFHCHADAAKLCHGWAVVGSSRGHEYELLALRLVGAGPVPRASVPLWASGLEAAQHGIGRMGKKAHALGERLKAAYPRLRDATVTPAPPRSAD